MKYALVQGKKMTPRPRQRGHCLYCGEEAVSKCGHIKIWHWSHKRDGSCDPWWDAESEWHRSWKNQFPAEWQEVVHTDEETGERHVADVKTDKGMVIEFQRSPISLEEMRSREGFYGNMIWVVDGDRGSTDPDYFRMGLSAEPVQLDPLAYGVKWWGPGHLLRNWSEASAPVFIDFGDGNLWRMGGFDVQTRSGTFGPIPPEWLIEACKSGGSIPAAAVEKEDVHLLRRRMERPQIPEQRAGKSGRTADGEVPRPDDGRGHGQTLRCPARSRSAP